MLCPSSLGHPLSFFRVLPFEPAQVFQRRVQVDERHGMLGDARLGSDARGADHQRYARALLPQRILEQVVLLTHVPAVVAGEHDDGVVG